MFRELVGADVFGKILSAFLETHAYSNATTTDFFDTVQKVTGEDYDWFFDQWLLRPGHPVLDISHTWDSRQKTLSITIKQTQDRKLGTPVYRLPVKIGITTEAGKTVENIWLDEEQQAFAFDVAEKPLLVRFDEGDILLKEWTFNKSTEELLYQLKHDQAIGRMWAVGELKRRINDPAVHLALLEASGLDPFSAVREKAAAAITPVESTSP
jgi:aminopeptidase N